MKKIKIALMIPNMTCGGAERVFIQLAGGFINRGYNVELVLARTEGPFMSELPANLRVVNLNLSRMLFSVLPLIKYIRSEHPDVMMVTRGDAVVFVILAKLFSFSSVRLIVREANTLSVESTLSGGIRNKLLFLAAKVLYQFSDKIVAVSQGVAEDLEKCVIVNKGQIVVINNPVDVDGIVIKAKDNVYHPFFYTGHPPVIIGVGRLTRQKDFASLIRAFAIVREKRQAKLLILGEGEDRSLLEQLVDELALNNEVSLYGFVQNPFPLIAHSDLFVLSSKWEGFPNVLVQAMACGTRVVATNCPSGAAEILDHGAYGLLVPVSDVKALAESIEKALDNPDNSEMLRLKCREYSEEVIFAQYLKVLLPEEAC